MVNPAIVNPTVNPAMVDPVVNPAIVNPIVNPAMVDPVVNQPALSFPASSLTPRPAGQLADAAAGAIQDQTIQPINITVNVTGNTLSGGTDATKIATTTASEIEKVMMRIMNSQTRRAGV